MQIPCIVERVTFRNESGFAILAVNLNAFSSQYNPELEELVASKCKKNEYNNFIVSLGMLDVNENPVGGQYVFVGDFTSHPKYGDQFKAEFYFTEEPNTEEGLKAFLKEKLPNIGDVRSQKIIELFGVQGTIDVLDNDPFRLTEIGHITEHRIPPIKEAWDKEKTLRELYMWLSEHKIEPKLGRIMYEKWKKDALAIIQENPYRLAEIRGISFVRADNIAHKIMDSIPIPYRTKACMQYKLFENLRKNSNLCMPLQTLKREVEELLTDCDDANRVKSPIDKHVAMITTCIKNNLDIFAAVKDLDEASSGAGVYIYLKGIWEKEKYIAEALHTRKHLESRKAECSLNDIVDSQTDVSKFSGRSIDLDECQKEAIKSAFEHKITVITGGGGTGKSTICRCIFYLAQKKGLSVRMMSPTGKAAQVLTDKTSCGAATIHRSLHMTPNDDYPRELIKEDVVIVDEASMVGVDTMFALMVAMEENLWGNLILVGDSNQLPSVSPGNFLSDIMKSECANVVKLDKIHRQDEKSYISLLANQIAEGKVANVPSDASDIAWHDVRPDEFEIVMKEAVQSFMDSGKGMDDLQIMAPMYKGYCGVNTTNSIIQNMMAKKNGTETQIMQRGFSKFYLYDRVIQTKNDYDKEVFNGDMGHIIALGDMVKDPEKSDKKERFVTVNFYGEDITYFEDEMENLHLAWCITVHKYQGSQSPYVFFVMSQETRNMMTKELVYTAFTRAEKHLDVYGSLTMLHLAPTRSALRTRYTNVIKLIREHRENRKLLKVLE